MPNKLIFISQPMSGLSEHEIDRVRSQIMDQIPFKLGIDNPVEVPKHSRYWAAANHPAACLGRSIMDMASANLVIFAPGWEKARGCVIERAVCKAYKLSYIELRETEEGYEIIEGDDE